MSNSVSVQKRKRKGLKSNSQTKEKALPHITPHHSVILSSHYPPKGFIITGRSFSSSCSQATSQKSVDLSNYINWSSVKHGWKCTLTQFFQLLCFCQSRFLQFTQHLSFCLFYKKRGPSKRESGGEKYHQWAFYMLVVNRCICNREFCLAW